MLFVMCSAHNSFRKTAQVANALCGRWFVDTQEQTVESTVVVPAVAFSSSPVAVAVPPSSTFFSHPTILPGFSRLKNN